MPLRAGLNEDSRGMVIDVNLEPTKGSETGKTRPAVVVTNNRYNLRVPILQVVPLTGYSKKKADIVTNVVVEPSKRNGLSKKSVADCLQTRPIDRRFRLVRIRGELEEENLRAVDDALRVLFSL